MRLVLVSHGGLAQGLVDSLQMLMGDQEDLLAFGLYPQEDRSQLQDEVRKVLEQKGKEEEIIIFSDLFHGSPFNVCVELSEHYDFQHITGVNLPLLIEAVMDRNMGRSAKEICGHIMQEAPGTIKDVNKLLENSSEEED